MRTALVKLNARPAACQPWQRPWPWALRNKTVRCSSTANAALQTEYQPPPNHLPNAKYKYSRVVPSPGETIPALQQHHLSTPLSQDLDGLSEFHDTSLHSASDELRKLDLWLRLLQSRARTEGVDGIASIWRHMMARRIDIPMSGHLADGFWRIFLRNQELHKPILKYAIRLKRAKGQVYLPLYAALMTQKLLDSCQDTLWWHNWFRKDYIIPGNALQTLTVFAVSSTTSLKRFKKIYKDMYTVSDRIYDQMITTLCHRNLYTEALQWHSLLIEHGEIPPLAISQSPALLHFRRFGDNLSASPFLNAPKERFIAKGHIALFVEPPKEAIGSELRFTRELMYTFLGKSHGIAPKHFSDDFCARLFATKAFSTSLVISCLNMFGVRSIGPLALREMAVRTETPREVTGKINDLKGAGIALGDCFFSRAVTKLAAENRSELLYSLLNTDQHPDVLEDVKIQRKLLASYIARGDWVSVHRTLTLITLFHKDPAQESWNILLRHYIRTGDTKRFQEVFEDMLADRIRFTTHSLLKIHTHLLQVRRPGHRPSFAAKVGSEKDDLSLVTNIYLRIVDNGQLVAPSWWRELIKRHGMTGRWDHLARLCLHLVKLYSPTYCAANTFTKNYTHKPPHGYEAMVQSADIDPSKARMLPAAHRAHPLRQLFPPVVQDAIVIWGFQHGHRLLYEHPERMRYCSSMAGISWNLPWPSHIKTPPVSSTLLSGLDLVQTMAESGVYVDIAGVRKSVKQRLWQLFSPGYSQRRINRLGHCLNPYSLEEILDAIQNLWRGPQLFPELLSKPLATQEEMPHSIIPTQRPMTHLTKDTLPRKATLRDEVFDVDVSQVLSVRTVHTHHPNHCKNSSASPCKINDLTPLTSEEEVVRRKNIVFALFGTTPHVGGGHWERRLGRQQWDLIVDRWARRGLKGRL